MARTRDTAKTRWVFTLNHPDKQSEEDDPQRLPYRYLVWQLERGDSGTPHYQGAVILKKKQRLSALKKCLPRAHFEPMGARDYTKAFDYCQKEEGRLEGPWIRGNAPRPGTRTDWAGLKALIDKHVPLKQVAREYYSLFIRYSRGIKEYRLLNMEPRNDRPTIIILWGDSGAGKTRFVRSTFPEAYWKPKNQWWDKYEHQEVVVFDEFYSWIKFDDMLRILDWYPLLVEIKGSAVEMTTSCFVFTSNQDPRDWYINMPDYRRQAFFRRLKEFGIVYHCTNEAWELDDLSKPRHTTVPFFHNGRFLDQLPGQR